jgi:hypothetical protein
MRANRTSKVRSVLAASAILAATAQLASADTFLWKAHVDANWDTATANWDNSTATTTNNTWINANPSHTAELSATDATPGTITVVPTGASAIDVGRINVTGTGDWTLATGNITRAGGGIITFDIDAANTLNMGAVITNGSNTLGATGALTTSLNIIGGGTLSINTPQTFVGAGTGQGIKVSEASTFRLNSKVGAGAQNALVLNFGNGLYFDNGTFLISDASTSMAGNNTMRVGPGGLTVTNNSTGGNFSFAGSLAELNAGTGGDITLGGTGGIRTAGGISTTGDLINASGTSYLYTNNTYGNLIINGGTVSLRNAGSLTQIPTTANVTLNAGAISFEGTAAFQTINNLSGAAGTSIALGASGSLTVAGTGTTTYAGTINTTTKLIKTNGGNLTLTGNSATTGEFTITGGTITAGTAGTIGTNGALGRGNITINGGTLTSNVANVNTGGASTGNFTLSAGTIDPNSTSAVGSFTLNTDRNFTMSGGTLDFNIASAASFDQIISRSTSTTSVFTITSGTLDLNLGPANSALYNNTYQILQGFDGANSVAGLTITDYDTTDWVATLDNTGLLSFAPASAIPEPASLTLLTLGAAALLTRRRK